MLAFALREACRGVSRSTVAVTAAGLSLAVGIGLLGGAVLVDAQLRHASGFWFDDSELQVLLCDEDCPPGVDPLEELEGELRSDPRVADVEFDSQQAAYHRLAEMLEGQPNPLVAVARGDVPPSLRVDLDVADDAPVIVAAYSRRPGVRAVINRHEALALPRTLLGGLRTAALVWAAVQLGAVVALVANSVTQSVHVRRRELEVMRLVGASRVQVYLPMVLGGAFVAVAGWALGWAPLVVYWPEVSRSLVGEVASFSPVGAAEVWAIGPPLLAVALSVTTLTAVVATRRLVP